MKLVGTKSNRDAIGAFARVTAAAAASPWLMVKTGSSYLSQSELPLTFGLGRVSRVSKIEVKWPDGSIQTLPGADANAALTIEEGKGLVHRTPSSRRCRTGDAMTAAATPRVMLRRAISAAMVLADKLPPQAPVPPPSVAAREDSYRANNIGVARLEQYDFAAATAAFRRALEIDRTLALARLNLGIALVYAGEPDAARKELEAVRAALPDRPQADYVLGLIARAADRTDDAVESFTRVRALDLSDVGAAINLGAVPAAAEVAEASPCSARRSRRLRTTPPRPIALHRSRSHGSG